MFVQLTEQVFVPEHTIKRVSYFGKKATVRFTDGTESTVEDEDAERLRNQLIHHDPK